MITLALGIGANTAIFTLVHAIMLRSLPVVNPAQLYRIGDKGQCCVEGGFPEDSATTGDISIFSSDLYQHLKKSAPEFEELAAAQAGGLGWSVRRNDELPKHLSGEYVSGNYFATFGVGAYEGRVFTDNDDRPAASPTVVLSYQAWQSEYAGDPSIVGSTIYLQARPFTVIGIAPPGFFGDRITDRRSKFLGSDQYGAICKQKFVDSQPRRITLALSDWPREAGNRCTGATVQAFGRVA